MGSKSLVVKSSCGSQGHIYRWERRVLRYGKTTQWALALEFRGHKDYENPEPSPEVAKFEPSRQAYYRSRDKYLRQFKIESTATDILNRNDLWGDVINAVFPDPAMKDVPGGGVDSAYQQVGAAKKVKVPVDCVFKLTPKARKMIGK